MREADRGMAMQSAIVALEYIAEPVPAAPSRYVMALRAVNMATQAASLGGGGSGGSRPKGTISDPTGTAAIRGIGDTTDLTDTHAIVLETAWCIRGDVTQALHDAHLTHPAPSTAAAALDHLRWAATIPHTTTNAVAAWRRAGRFEDAAMLDTSIDLVCREACNLAVMVRAASSKVARAPEDVPTQKKIESCRNCAKWRTGTIAAANGLCDECKRFQGREHCLPTEPIVRRWEVGQNATPGQIIEAKANRRKSA
jgi:hypothetical protein